MMMQHYKPDTLKKLFAIFKVKVIVRVHKLKYESFHDFFFSNQTWSDYR